MLPVAQNTENLALLPFEATVDMVTVAEAETRLLLLLLPTYCVVGGTFRPHGGTVVCGVHWIVWLKCSRTHFASRVDGVTGITGVLGISADLEVTDVAGADDILIC